MIAADCVYEISENDELEPDEEKPFADGNVKVDDGSVVFTFDEPKNPAEVTLQLKDSPDVTVTLKNDADEPVKTLVTFTELAAVLPIS